MIPFYYDYQNAIDSSIQPSTIHVHDNALAVYLKRYLLFKVFSVFKFGIPKDWNLNFFRYTTFILGHGCVVNTDKFGIIFQNCGLYGYNVNYQPTNAIITNPLLTGIMQPRIGVETELIKINDDYGGIYDIINYYGDLLALAAETSATNLLNSKTAFLYGAQNKTFAESIKKAYDKFASGEPLVVIDKNLYDENGNLMLQMFQQKVKETYIAGDILADMRKIESEFDTRIGIPNANTDKRERLITDEVNANNVETECLSDIWLENLKDSFERVNAMFGLNLTVEKRYKRTTTLESEVEE